MTAIAPIRRLQLRIQEVTRADAALARGYVRGSFTRAERQTLRQGLYVSALRHFERFLEDQLVALASGKSKWTPRVVDGQSRIVRPRIYRTSVASLEDIVSLNKEYFDPLPWERGILPAAKVLLYEGVPFSVLSDPELSNIRRVVRIRNCIAHDSPAAKEKMRKSLSQIGGLNDRERREPGRYLDAMFSLTDDYFKHDLRTLLRIGQFLS